MTQRAEIKALASDLRDHLSWLREEGFDTWKSAVPLSSSPLRVHDLPLTLQGIRADLGDCQRCSLGTTRTHLVFGVGNAEAELMFVGEGPGADEDRQGEPFVGKAGQLLTKMIGAMGLSREQVYIANIIKCRPPQNRNPQAEEIAACEPFLDQQISAIRPKIICALGTFAAQTLLKTQTRISDLRGHFHDLRGVKVLPTFHPAYLLRNPGGKKQVWSDLQLIMADLNLPMPVKR